MADDKTRIGPTALVYPPLKGIRYLRMLQRLHAKFDPDWYFEIGTATGTSLQRAPGKAICVDPNFQISSSVLRDREETHFFQMTSDDFFASGRIRGITSKIDLAFLDGMHLFEFLLRDFMNTEKLTTKTGVIALHDCVPITPLAAERHWNKSETAAWTGDVWKVIPILKEFRPDLKITIFDCPPSGLVVIENLSPESKVLDENYDAIIAKYLDMSLFDFGVDELYNLLDIQPSSDSEASLALVGR